MPQKIKIIYQDDDLLVADKPSGTITFRENQIQGTFMVDLLLKEVPELENVGEPPRYGAIHRLDKETSGIVLIAKNNESFRFFQDQFKKRKVIKEYLALCTGNLKNKEGVIETNIGRSPKDRRKQRVFPLYDPKNNRKAITRYRVLKNFENYTLIKVIPETGRKHQIRCHMTHIKHPLAGDSLYGFKNQPCPEKLERHFLHAEHIRINTPNSGYKMFSSEIPNDLKKVLESLD